MTRTKNGPPGIAGIFLLSILLICIFVTPVTAENMAYACYDLDTCTEWVNQGSLSLQWGKTGQMQVGGVKYTFRADDFDLRSKSAIIIVESEGTVSNKFMSMTARDTDRWFKLDNEIKVILKDVTEDSYKTPSAHIEIYGRGLPLLDIAFEASSERIKEIDISSEQYAPEQEKKIIVSVKNRGNAWADDVILKVNLGDFRLKGINDFEYHGNEIVKNLGCIGKDTQQSINFTIIAPKWDGKTSPYDLDQYINASAYGNDIKKDYYYANASKVFHCTEPKLEVVFEVVGKEINMTAWSARQEDGNEESNRKVHYEMKDAWEYSFIRTTIYNIGFYAVNDVEVDFAKVPEELINAETFEHGNHRDITPGNQYHCAKKLVPLRPGTYNFGPVNAKADFFGKEYTWSSGTGSITVHGPRLSLEKKLTLSDTGYKVNLLVKNDGDRAAWMNLNDVIPDNVGYVNGSAEKSLAGSDLALSDWDISVTQLANNSSILAVTGVLLPPGTSLEMNYDIGASAPDLPAAIATFKAVDNYHGEVRSSYYVAGAEVKQSWDMLKGWCSIETLAPLEPVKTVQTPPEEETLQSVENEIVIDTPIAVQIVDTTPIGWLSDQFSAVVLRVQALIDSTLGDTIEEIGIISSVVENMAVDAMDNHLYMVVIIIALGVFMLVYVLTSR